MALTCAVWPWSRDRARGGSLSPDGVEFFRKQAYATEGSYQHIGRVRAGEAGLAR